MRLIGPRLHGYIDIVLVVCFALGPLLYGLGGPPAALSLFVAAVLLFLTLITRFPLGVVRTVPLAVHGLVELAITIFIAALPRLGGYSPGSPARIFFWTMAVVLAIVWLLSDYREQEWPARPDARAARPQG